MKQTSLRVRSGFTLMEILVVLVVVGILVGIVLSLAGGLVDRSRETATRDLCIQVADAWTALSLDPQHGRLPSKALVESVVKTEPCGGGEDVWIRMTPAAGFLLNAWRKKNGQLPAADRRLYEPPIAKDGYPTYDELLDLESAGFADAFFERSLLQKRAGLCASWLERKIVESAETEIGGSAAHVEEFDSETIRNLAAGEGEHGVVRVALDLDGDGTITIPAGDIGTAEDAVVRATAVAWVWNEERTKTVRSW